MENIETSLIRRALNAGGVLTVNPVMRGKSIFRAGMAWPYEDNEPNISGGLSTSLLGALENLELELKKDAPL
jgi:hypothetical protein